MSKLTTTQVIALGTYLDADFEPSSLTVSQLLGVLGFHNVQHPTPYSKAKLVQVFNSEIKANGVALRRQRLKKDSSAASDDGIMDGVTGKPISKLAPPARRASRRLSRAPTEEEAEPRPEPPKRRRSSAQPTLGGPSRTVIVQPSLTEESEPEEDEMPVRKVGKTRKTAVNRRVSLAEDSGWEDNNIFQSGAESSSPARPSPVRPKSRRSAPRKSRKSASAPPQTSPLSSPTRSHHEMPQSRFEPHLPLLPSPRSPFVPKLESRSGTPFLPKEESALDDQPAASGDVSDEPETNEQGDVEGKELVMSNFDDLGLEPMSHEPLPLVLRLLLFLLAIGFSVGAAKYKMESAPIGYCDTGRDTNDVLEDLRVSRQAIELCNRENRTTLHEGDDTPCPLPVFVPSLHPDSCTSCPEHATCGRDSVNCDTGYILRAHPFFFYLPAVPSPTNVNLTSSTPPNELAWKFIAEVSNGLPGLGSVAFPPLCVEDPKRKRHIGALGKAIDRMLALERGKILCAGLDSTNVLDRDGGDAKKWGMEFDELRSTLRTMTAKHLLPTFDDMFNEAIQQLVQWGGIIIGEDASGNRYIAHKTPNLTLGCAVIVKFRGVWRAWRLTMLGLVLSAAGISALRARSAKNWTQMKRVNELVPVVLKAIRDAEMAHHVDPVTSPQPFVSSVQLRDLLVPHDTRDGLWTKVARIVEGNTNVRVNLEEGNGGNEMRVWRWVGSSTVHKTLEDASRETAAVDSVTQ